MLPGFRGAMAFLNLLTLFHRERVAGAAILSLLREGGFLEGKGKGAAILSLLGRERKTWATMFSLSRRVFREEKIPESNPWCSRLNIV